MHWLMLLALAGAPLGIDGVSLDEHDFGAGPVFLNLHADEVTSVKAALAVAKRRGGQVLNVVNGRQRLVGFDLGGKRYLFDPNRVFTPAGIPATLRLNSRDAPDAEARVRAFASKLLPFVDRADGRPVVALHNNTADLGYSVKSYEAGGKDAGEAEAVFEAPNQNPNDFFLVTRRAHFDALQARGFNAVLQKPVPRTDDGSLSVWAAQHRKAYVNVEAQHGHQAEQERMLEALYEVLSPP